MLKDVINFKINDYNPHLSDHCNIRVKIQSKFTFHEQRQLRAAPRNLKWSETPENKFLHNSDTGMQKIKHICSKIDDLNQNKSSEKEFQEIVSKFSNSLHTAAFGINPTKYKKKRHTKLRKPW